MRSRRIQEIRDAAVDPSEGHEQVKTLEIPPIEVVWAKGYIGDISEKCGVVRDATNTSVHAMLDRMRSIVDDIREETQGISKQCC